MTPQRHPERGRVGHMSRARRYSLYVTSSATWITGALWIVFHYFLKSTDGFGFESSHPGEKWWLIAHAFCAFAAIWWFGLLWPNHIVKSWKAHIRRGTGGVLFGCTAWLVLTGYALYYIGNEDWRSWTSILHWAVGLGALGAFVYHLQTRTPRVARAQNPIHR